MANDSFTSLFNKRKRQRWCLINLQCVHLYLLFIFWVCSGCVTPEPTPHFMITSTHPEQLERGAQVHVYGVGFQEELGVVAVGGRPLIIQRWSSTSVIAEVPLDTPGGEGVMVLSRGGQLTPAFPIYVLGEGGERLGAPPLSDSPPDLGMITQRDMLLSPDQTLPPDDDVTTTLDHPTAQITFTARLDPSDLSYKTLDVLIKSDPSHIFWGIASLFKYPLDQLEFVGTVEAESTNLRAVQGELNGVITWYRVNPDQGPVITLRFIRKDPTDMTPLSFQFIPRFSATRDIKNISIPTTWSDGVVTFSHRTSVEVMP